MNSNDEIDNIIEQLKADAVQTGNFKEKTQTSLPPPTKITDDTANDYVYQKAAQLVETNLSIINSIKDSIASGLDPKELASLAQLMSVTNKALDTINNINLQNKQAKNNIEMKKIEAEGRKSLPPATTNVLIATREEVMTKIFDKNLKNLE
jgi:hypothetical protein